ncbi:hypothetical protein PPTG_21732 [Phytophthora nicotianae INRA-310]|uniref:Uncharacterized protein n=1 Tax=Phytophthora nicotianae (strain INRA-310) TaxID=761204 RepID=W2QVJ9_PHYN3|nr:hypothetical protein PPTG_21732 [Phytophthora nicotianae INRA-310]ETN16504.1 hypothetical protein PPTG_21732 [Phytophthora nicotianae INRA-310]
MHYAIGHSGRQEGHVQQPLTSDLSLTSSVDAKMEGSLTRVGEVTVQGCRESNNGIILMDMGNPISSQARKPRLDVCVGFHNDLAADTISTETGSSGAETPSTKTPSTETESSGTKLKILDLAVSFLCVGHEWWRLRYPSRTKPPSIS